MIERCINPEKAVFTIQGKREAYDFEITKGNIMLRRPNLPELQHLIGKQMTPGCLLYELQKCGVLLMPVRQDAQVAEITEKEEAAEDQAIQDIGFASRSFYIKSSKWNNSIPEDRVLCRVRENPEYDEEFHEDQEKLWKTVCWWKNKCGIIMSKDSSQNCNQTLLKDTTTHSTFSLLLKKHEE